MSALILLAWPQGLPTHGSFDPAPLIWTALLLWSAWGLHLRLHWWSVAPAAAAGMVCTTMSSHFGLWAAAIVAASVLTILKVLHRVPEG